MNALTAVLNKIAAKTDRIEPIEAKVDLLLKK